MLSISKNYTKNTNHLPFNVFFKQTHLATPKKKKKVTTIKNGKTIVSIIDILSMIKVKNETKA